MTAPASPPSDRDELIDRLYRAHKSAAESIAEFGIPDGEREEAVERAWSAVLGLGPDPETEPHATSDEIAELRRLHEEATPAPWVEGVAADGSKCVRASVPVLATTDVVARFHGGRTAMADRALVVAARNHLGALILAAERAEGLADALEKILAAGPDAVGMMLIARAALAAYRGSAGGAKP